MQLSEHFSLEELVRSDYAIRKGLDNTPNADAVANLTVLALGLEHVRALLGHPLHINSAYRGPKVNSAVGGSKTSAHMQGFAADFVCPEYGSPAEICRAIMDSTIDYDQLIYEGGWVHFSVAPEMRHINLTAHFGPKGVSYTNGIT